MSGDKTVHGSGLRILELPESADRRLTVWFPAPEREAFGREAFTVGQELVLDAAGARHRAVILSADVRDGGVELAMQIRERLPLQASSRVARSR